MIKFLLPLALGGSLGAVARWLVQQAVDQRWPAAGPFPLGILVVNGIGCFAFGLLFGWMDGRAWAGESLRLAIFTGFLGSFTTFATFGWNTLELLRQGQMLLAGANVLGSVALGLVAVWGGYSLVR